MNSITTNLNPQKPIHAHHKKVKTDKNGKEKDILHEPPVRYLAYSDDLGNALKVACKDSAKGIVRALPILSYVPALGYVAADVIDKYKKGDEESNGKPSIKAGVKQGIFQGLTSLLFPAGVVFGTEKIASKGLNLLSPKMKNIQNFPGKKLVSNLTKNLNSDQKRKIALVAINLAALIALSRTIDNFTEKVLMKKVFNPVVDKLFKKKPGKTNEDTAVVNSSIGSGKKNTIQG